MLFPNDVIHLDYQGSQSSSSNSSDVSVWMGQTQILPHGIVIIFGFIGTKHQYWCTGITESHLLDQFFFCYSWFHIFRFDNTPGSPAVFFYSLVMLRLAILILFTMSLTWEYFRLLYSICINPLKQEMANLKTNVKENKAH